MYTGHDAVVVAESVTMYCLFVTIVCLSSSYYGLPQILNGDVFQVYPGSGKTTFSRHFLF